jgi:hypothetical protein
VKSEELFREDFSSLKGLILCLAILITAGLIAGILAILIMYIMFLNGHPVKIFEEQTTKDAVSMIAYVTVLTLIATSCYIYAFKSKRLKYAVIITESRLIFCPPIDGKTQFEASDLTQVKTVQLWRNIGKIKLTFGDKAIIMPTRKYSELKSVLEYLLERNKEKPCHNNHDT